MISPTSFFVENCSFSKRNEVILYKDFVFAMNSSNEFNSETDLEKQELLDPEKNTDSFSSLAFRSSKTETAGSK